MHNPRKCTERAPIRTPQARTQSLPAAPAPSAEDGDLSGNGDVEIPGLPRPADGRRICSRTYFDWARSARLRPGRLSKLDELPYVIGLVRQSLEKQPRGQARQRASSIALGPFAILVRPKDQWNRSAAGGLGRNIEQDTHRQLALWPQKVRYGDDFCNCSCGCR
jgi:hypothetical protein